MYMLRPSVVHAPNSRGPGFSVWGLVARAHTHTHTSLRCAQARCAHACSRAHARSPHALIKRRALAQDRGGLHVCVFVFSSVSFVCCSVSKKCILRRYHYTPRTFGYRLHLHVGDAQTPCACRAMRMHVIIYNTNQIQLSWRCQLLRYMCKYIKKHVILRRLTAYVDSRDIGSPWLAGALSVVSFTRLTACAHLRACACAHVRACASMHAHARTLAGLTPTCMGVDMPTAAFSKLLYCACNLPQTQTQRVSRADTSSCLPLCAHIGGALRASTQHASIYLRPERRIVEPLIDIILRLLLQVQRKPSASSHACLRPRSRAPLRRARANKRDHAGEEG